MHAAALLTGKGVEQRAATGLQGLRCVHFQVKKPAAAFVINRHEAARLIAATVLQPVQMLRAAKALVAIGMAGWAYGAQQWPVGWVLRAGCEKHAGGQQGLVGANIVNTYQRAFFVLSQQREALGVVAALLARLAEVMRNEERDHG